MIDLIRLVCPQAHRLVSDNDQAQDAQKAKVSCRQMWLKVSLITTLLVPYNLLPSKHVA